MDGTQFSPLAAKALKDNFNHFAQQVVDAEEALKESDGVARLYVRYGNGYDAVLEPYDAESEPSTTYVHDCTHTELKKNWSTVSAAIIFDVGFRFKFRNSNGKMIALIFSRAIINEHSSEDFLSDIISGYMAENESAENAKFQYHLNEIQNKLEKMDKFMRSRIK